MTGYHSRQRLSITGFAARAGVKAKTLEAYIARRQPKANPVPAPCGTEALSGWRWWCVRHADQWIARRPRANQPDQETK